MDGEGVMNGMMSKLDLTDEMILSPKNLMDKMVIRCPNVGHCNEVLPKFNLDEHLKRRCRGGKRIKTYNNHQDDKQQCCEFNHSHSNGHVEGQVGESDQSSANTTTSSSQSLTSASSTSSKFIDLRDRISVLHIYKGQSSCLGISIVGGIDTPLSNIVVQEVVKNGAAYRDGRLTAGDHILEVNGIDLTSISHLDAVRALSRPSIVTQLTICKEGNISSLSKQETLSVSLRKQDDNQLGIKLIQKKHLKGIFILEIIPGGIADWDGRLQSDDLILQVNERDILEASQEEAVHIIKASPSQVTLLVSRIPSSQFPISPPHLSSPLWCDDVSITSDDDGHLNFFDLQFMPRDKVIQVQKMEGEYLGLSIGGGTCNGKHNTPIYITNLWTGGCLAKTNQLMKGDVLLSVNRTNLLNTSYEFSAKILKSASKKCYVTVHILQGSETSDGNGNFTPSWKFWLALPQFCYFLQNVIWRKDRQIEGLCFSMTGGFKISVGPMPIIIKTVQENSYAQKFTGLKSGDIVLSVNGISLDGATQGDAVRLMTSLNQDQLELTIVSWPGSSV